MFSIGKGFTAPNVKVDINERKAEYHPRTYSQFIKGLKKNELPAVVVNPKDLCKHICFTNEAISRAPRGPRHDF